MNIVATDRRGAVQTLTAAPDANLMELLRDEGLEVEAVCGGCCSCATCHVLIEPAWLSRLPPRGEMETELLSLSEHFDAQRSRLSCQLTCSADLDGLALTVAPED